MIDPHEESIEGRLIRARARTAVICIAAGLWIIIGALVWWAA